MSSGLYGFIDGLCLGVWIASTIYQWKFQKLSQRIEEIRREEEGR